MNRTSVLVVDDDQNFRSYLAALLQTEGYDVEGLENGAQLTTRLTCGRALPSVILLDILLPDTDGIEIMRKIQSMGLHVPVIILSGVEHIKTIVDAMKLGACDFLIKPFDEAALESAINTVLENFPGRQSGTVTQQGTEDAGTFVTLNPEMRRLAEIVRRVAHTDVPILISGESGVGKEVMAKHAHLHSGRQDEPFIKINCAAIPQELLESELFGYERGAFTGAVTDKPGKFELADRGTLLLDEIGEMSPLLQAKLLHVLQDGTFSRLGGRRTVKVDVRIIAATNINIDEAVGSGKFREDLYFRLNVIRVDLPPLRERTEDIPALCHLFLEKYGKQYNSSCRELPPELFDRFMRYHWPGNIRELENRIKRFLVLPGDDASSLEAAPPDSSIQAGAETAVVVQPLSLLGVGAHAAERAEQELVRRVLQETNGNRKAAARRMNICYKALLNKLKRWAGPPPVVTQTQPRAE